ncbi:MAG: FxsA family protein, partial [Parvibaculales bacterium]
MPGLIPLILIIVPIIEITLFVQIGGAIGLGWTLLVILATAMLGARAIRRQGIDALARAQAQMATGKPPVGEIVHGVLILMAGILLLTPGFLTDALGFLLLFPATR